MEYFVYILKCKDGTYYTGMTNDLERRFYEHRTGWDAKAYTHSRRPVTLVFSETFNDPMTAIAAEKRIKRWSRKKKEALIRRDWDNLKLLSKKKHVVQV